MLLNLADTFRTARKKWHGNGSGSDWERTSYVRAKLPEIIHRLKIKTMLDYGCGTPEWILVAASIVDYIGIDVVPELIDENRKNFPGLNFILMSSFGDDLPKSDLIVVRDVFSHLSNVEIKQALVQFKRSDSKWLLVTTNTGQCSNTNTLTGGFRPLNLEKIPFNLSPPLEIIEEGHEGKTLGLWSLSS